MNTIKQVKKAMVIIENYVFRHWLEQKYKTVGDIFWGYNLGLIRLFRFITKL